MRLVLGAILISTLLASSGIDGPIAAYAQAPYSWQQAATGLVTSSNPNKMTAGLAIRVQDQGWPWLSLQGGVYDDGFSDAMGPVGVDLGLAELPTASSSALTGQSADWAHDTLTYNGGTSAELDVTASRLSPALLIDVPSAGPSTVRLLTGNVGWYVNAGQTGLNSKQAPAFPKWIGYSSGGVMKTIPLSSSTTQLPALDNNWLLVWYGTNSYFDDTSLPPLYPFPQSPPICCAVNNVSVPNSSIFQADAPLLLHFQTNPTAIDQSSSGGIDLTFGANPGNLTVLPLYGRQHLAATTTDTWGSQGLPSDAVQKISFWIGVLCSFPQTASESYSYDSPSDTTTVTENVTFIPACGSTVGTQLAPLPPMVGVVSGVLPLTFSGPITDASLPTDFGPFQGIEGTASYTWSMTGLGKYLTDTRTVGSSSVPPDPLNALTAQVNSITQSGHYAPWFVPSAMPMYAYNGDLYFDNPGEILTVLADVVPVLPDPQKTNLINYMRSERSSYPPESTYNLTLGQGTARVGYSLADQSLPGGNFYTQLPSQRPDLFLTQVPLYNFYALARYYDTTGDSIPSTLMGTANTVLDSEMLNRDWATGSSFYGFAARKTAVENANRLLDGAIGLARLSNVTGDTVTHALAMGILLRATALRVGMAHYPRWLATTSMISLPTDPNWQPEDNAAAWLGRLANYGWTDSSSDARQVVVLDQFGLILDDSSGYSTGTGVYAGQTTGSGYGYLPAFRDLTPESAAILRDYAKSDVDIPITKYMSEMPGWYAAFGETPFGDEHSVSFPVDSYSIFMAKVWIDGDTIQNLGRYADVSWLSGGGDLYYVAKLAETARAYENGSVLTLPVQK